MKKYLGLFLFASFCLHQTVQSAEGGEKRDIFSDLWSLTKNIVRAPFGNQEQETVFETIDLQTVKTAAVRKVFESIENDYVLFSENYEVEIDKEGGVGDTAEEKMRALLGRAQNFKQKVESAIEKQKASKDLVNYWGKNKDNFNELLDGMNNFLGDANPKRCQPLLQNPVRKVNNQEEQEEIDELTQWAYGRKSPERQMSNQSELSASDDDLDYNAFFADDGDSDDEPVAALAVPVDADDDEDFFGIVYDENNKFDGRAADTIADTMEYATYEDLTPFLIDLKIQADKAIREDNKEKLKNLHSKFGALSRSISSRFILGRATLEKRESIERFQLKNEKTIQEYINKLNRALVHLGGK